VTVPVDADKAIHEIVRGIEDGIDVKVLVGHLIPAMGGYEGIADKFSKDYQASSKGGGTRARMMSDMIKLILACTDSSHGDEQVSDDEVEAEARALLEENQDG